MMMMVMAMKMMLMVMVKMLMMTKMRLFTGVRQRRSRIPEGLETLVESQALVRSDLLDVRSDRWIEVRLESNSQLLGSQAWVQHQLSSPCRPPPLSHQHQPPLPPGWFSLRSGGCLKNMPKWLFCWEVFLEGLLYRKAFVRETILDPFSIL